MTTTPDGAPVRRYIPSVFADAVHDEFASWVLGFAPYGGGDVGEVQVLSSHVEPGHDDSFFDAFSALAHRRIEEGDAAAAKGHRTSARDCYLRAAGLLGVAYHPLYGTPVDGRLVGAFHVQMDTFAKATALADPPGEEVSVLYEGTMLPACFLRAPSHEHNVRPVILVGGGWDSTMVENYLGIGAAALARGYHVLLHDGPGQGRLLVDEGKPLRHDWEHVVTPIVDAALGSTSSTRSESFTSLGASAVTWLPVRPPSSIDWPRSSPIPVSWTSAASSRMRCRRWG
jgi:hypothetical protein